MLDVSCMIEAQHLMWFKRYIYRSNKALVDYFPTTFWWIKSIVFVIFLKKVSYSSIPVFL